jgi:transcriptional regulator with XRE-family HTH domain
VPEEVIDEAAPRAPSVPVPPEQALAPPQDVPEGDAGDDELPPSGTEQPSGAEQAPMARRGRRARDRGVGGPRSNALGVLIEQRFADPKSPVRSYSELERRSGISREALSRYVTPRPDRRRSPTIDTLAAIADAMRISLEQVCRAGVASAHGASLPPEAEQEARAEVVAPLVATLNEDQFSAVVELLRQMQPRVYGGSEPE